jgi:hypothetical protein
MARNVLRVEEKRNASWILKENLNFRDHLEDIGLDGKIILNYI